MDRATACSPAVGVHNKILLLKKGQQAGKEQQRLSLRLGTLQASSGTGTGHATLIVKEAFLIRRN